MVSRKGKLLGYAQCEGPSCEETFPQYRTWQKFCSTNCRMRYHATKDALYMSRDESRTVLAALKVCVEGNLYPGDLSPIVKRIEKMIHT